MSFFGRKKRMRRVVREAQYHIAIEELAEELVKRVMGIREKVEEEKRKEEIPTGRLIRND